ncbi:JAB domain-containing protein [Castellaniella sp.]|uniref:JAB domain-containing protein n=1 Tax=Castellaniella sp. TaxID=1955812 RepID=UPI002AFF2AA6|nr:JAB domain-containing protein [Castellaniella sp.]
MSQLSFSSFDDALLVRDAQGRYLPASVDQILEAARQAIELKMQRGAEFTSPALVKEYLRNKLAGFEHEVFAVLFLDTRHRLIEYAEMFRGTITSLWQVRKPCRLPSAELFSCLSRGGFAPPAFIVQVLRARFYKSI